MEVKLLSDGFKLLIVGQFVVLSFIGCMILMITAIAKVIQCFEKAPVPGLAMEPGPESPAEEEEMTAAIGALMHHNQFNCLE